MSVLVDGDLAPLGEVAGGQDGTERQVVVEEPVADEIEDLVDRPDRIVADRVHPRPTRR
ncbi:hypothetical protein WDV91_16155 [Curtobacterium flaccumfaciens pv. flaccumfaciens]